MDLLKPFKKVAGSMNRHPVPTILGSVALFAALVSGGNYLYNGAGSKKIYDGTINEQRVVYEENAGHMGGLYSADGKITANFRQNRMNITRGDIRITLVDHDDIHPIDYQAERQPVGFEQDTLETIVINSPKVGLRTYKSSDVSTSTLYGKHTARVVARANMMYNALRFNIRGKLRGDALADYSMVEGEFNSIDFSITGKPEEKPGVEPGKKLKQTIDGAVQEFVNEVESFHSGGHS